MKSRNRNDILKWPLIALNKYQLLGFIIIAVAIVFYNLGWDFIVGAKILAFNSAAPATVWDMGAFYGRIWGSIHSQTLDRFLVTVIPSPITLVLSPLSYFNSPFLFAYFQTAWISFTAVPIYFISLKKLQSVTASTIFTVTFLLFFGIAGLNWFDIHFQSLFLPLFTTAVCLFYYEKYKTSAVLMVLSGSVHYLFMIFPIIFYLIFFIEKISENRKFVMPKIPILVPALVSVIFLTGSIYLEYHIGGGGAILRTARISPNNSGILANLENGTIDSEIQTFLLYLAPFMMLPLLSKRYLPPMLLYFFLLFFSAQLFYRFPYVLRLQLAAMLIPFLFLGTLDVLEEMGNPQKKQKDYLDKHLPPESEYPKIRKIKKTKNDALKFIILIFVITILLGSVYEPYGPVNKYSQADFGLNSVLDYNVTLYDVFNAMVDLIPPNNPYVLYQNNMPEVIFHDPSVLSAFIFGYSNNFTYPLGTAYTKPFWSGDIEYIIADPYNGFLSGGSGNFSLNMYTTLRHFISQGDYGVEAEYDGLILLKKGFTGPPVIYGPENRFFSANQLYPVSNGGIISATNAISGQTVWWGPYTFLQPGIYDITLEVEASNISFNNHFYLRFSYMNSTDGRTTKGPIVLSLTNVTGKDIPAPNTWAEVTVRVVASNFLEFVEFAGQSFDWQGSFSIKAITVTQVAPL